MSFSPTTTSFLSSPPPLPSSSSSSSWRNVNPSAITAILVLSITVVVTASLCLLIRYITHRCRHRHSNTAFVIPAVSQHPSSRRVAPESQNLSPLNSLPLFSFNSVTNSHNTLGGGDGNSDCAVCLSKFEPHDQLRLLPVCCHAFHASCVDTWLQSNQTCPLCRSQVFIPDSEILGKILRESSGSFRIEIGSVSRRQGSNTLDSSLGVPRSYSIGSFDYIVQDDSSEVNIINVVSSEASKENQDEAGMNVNVNGLAEEVGTGSSRRWLRDYVDRFSASFRSSGRLLSGSSLRYNVENPEQVVEVNRTGEEITEFFGWLSAV